MSTVIKHASTIQNSSHQDQQSPSRRFAPTVGKRSSTAEVHATPAKLQLSSSTRQAAESSSGQKIPNKVPPCLIKLVRSIVRTFYSREHSLIVDMLVRNTIMKEDDLCERLRFERKQLRQYLHTLKSDQFIKSKIQLETDSEGKTTKITHYFIDYKLFVNVVKYRLDQMQRRLETEQRQSSNRATFKCAICNTTYTDLEVDRLMDFANPGKLICVYCRSEVIEEEVNASCTDARALIAKFHHQVREPIDVMLRECDEIHLSSSILEPEIRPLEPLSLHTNNNSTYHDALDGSQTDERRSTTYFGPSESSVRIVLSGDSHKLTQVSKEHPIWMADSTICSDFTIGFTETERTSGSTATNVHASVPLSCSGNGDSITQTLAPGRVPTGFSSTNGSNPSGYPKQLDGTSESSGTVSSSSDIMQLLMIHERRGQSNQHLVKASNATGRTQKPALKILHDSEHHPSSASEKNGLQSENTYEVTVGDRSIPYHDISPAVVRMMTPSEKAEYVRIGREAYMGMMID